ncbi:hypothetical protein K438DRAFT_2007674 [Mycena galopus ATCC 62051]|nr:hypothetical protein K438DRAFT_2007674 [Mycena galopus ATCC 62051]
MLCKKCYPDGIGDNNKWIGATDGVGEKHLKSNRHNKAVRVQQEQERSARRMEDERRTVAPGMLNHVEIRIEHLAGPSVESFRAADERQRAELRLDNATGADFRFGEDMGPGRTVQDELREAFEGFGVWNVTETAWRLGFEDAESIPRAQEEDEDKILAEILRIADLIDHNPTGINAALGESQLPKTDEKWFPYPSKLMFLLDFIDNLPRLRLSSVLMRMFIFVLKEAKCQDAVPSYDRFRDFQKDLREQCGTPTLPCRSPLGNIFFMNDVQQIIANDYANPTTRWLLNFYPEITEDGAVCEFYQAGKLRREMDLNALSPMYNAGRNVHYYVNEVARLKDGTFNIPIRWVVFKGVIHADFLEVKLDGEGNASVISTPSERLVSVTELALDFQDLEHAGAIPQWTDTAIKAGYPSCMPNPQRKIANKRPLYHSFVDYFTDNVSGNRSKAWNKHYNGYLTHRNLPRQLLQQEFHVHFISTSQNASVAEQYREFKARVDEISAHIGGQGNHPCRKCEVGGTQEEKATLEGFHKFFDAGTPRTKDGVWKELENQIKLACAGVAAPIKDAQTRTGIKDPYTQFWIDNILSRFKSLSKATPCPSPAEIKQQLLDWVDKNRAKIENPFYTTHSLDPTKDTPVEILHTMLLGITKYIWHVTHTKLSTNAKKTYVPRLQATDTAGLSIPAICAGYILQYAGSLVGRQLKILVQTSPFHVGDLVDDPMKFAAWKAAGELAALLWVPEIKNMEQYRADLKIAVANVLDVFATLNPSKIIAKMKYHLLCHLDVDVERMGPFIGFATENYEAFNAIFRHCSILLNHLSPSRDIALQLAKQEQFKHIITGGSWAFLAQHPILQKLIGWSETKKLVPGQVKLVSKMGQKDREAHELASTLAAKSSKYSAQSQWFKGVHVLPGKTGELSPAPICGAIADILWAKDKTALVVLKQLRLLPERDEWYSMPVLVPELTSVNELCYLLVPGKTVLFDFNAQHDCHGAKCEATGSCSRAQEHQASGKIENFIIHQPLEHYILNLCSFHNTHLIRETLPRNLCEPIPLYEDRKDHHDTLAQRI